MRGWLTWWLTKASRETSSGNFIPVIDGLRFIAITSVILYHIHTFVTRKNEAVVADPLVALLSTGDIGVNLFFVISGFIIALPFARGNFQLAAPPSLRSYYLRRLTRLEPPYILCLLLLFPLSVSVIHLSPHDLLPHLVASIFYLHNIVYGEMSAVNFVAWSLEVELQFYLLAPLLALVFLIPGKNLRRSILALLIAFCSLLSYYIVAPTLRLSIIVMAQYFLTGFLLVDIYLNEWKDGFITSWRWDVASCAAWASVFALHSTGRNGDLFMPIPIFLAYICAFRGKWSNRFFSQPVVYVLGGMCYTLYLYHYTCTFAVGRIMERTGLVTGLPPWGQVLAIGAAALPATVIFCSFLFVAVEKPCMKRDWHLRLLDRLKDRAAVVKGSLASGSKVE